MHGLPMFCNVTSVVSSDYKLISRLLCDWVMAVYFTIIAIAYEHDIHIEPKSYKLELLDKLIV